MLTLLLNLRRRSFERERRQRGARICCSLLCSECLIYYSTSTGVSVFSYHLMNRSLSSLWTASAHAHQLAFRRVYRYLRLTVTWGIDSSDVSLAICCIVGGPAYVMPAYVHSGIGRLCQESADSGQAKNRTWKEANRMIFAACSVMNGNKVNIFLRFDLFGLLLLLSFWQTTIN